MSGIFEKNMSALKKADPTLFNRIARCDLSKEPYQFIGDGKNLNILLKDRKLFYYDPEKRTESIQRELEKVDTKNPKLTVCLGFGLGIHLSQFIRRTVRPGMIKKILLIERDIPILKMGLHVTDIADLIIKNQIHIIAGEQQENLYGTLYRYLMEDSTVKLFAKSMAVVPVNAAMAIDKEYYLGSIKYMREAINQTLQNFGNSPEDSLWGLENMLSNVDYTFKNPGIIHLKDKFVGKTAIIVAAGPSLQKNIDLLKEVGDRALIICVDTAFRILLRRGIYPHMVTSIERGISTLKYYNDLEEYQPDLKNVYFAPATVVRRELYETCVDGYGMRPVMLHRDFAHAKWMEVEKGRILSGKSSANLAFAMLTYMGFSKIILVGQDLAFGADDKTHIDGADHSIQGMQKSPKIKETMWVRGNFVEKIKTIRTWYNFLRHYENDIAKYDGVVINATEGGARIEGTKLQTLAETVGELGTSGEIAETIEKGLGEFKEESIEKDRKTLSRVTDTTLTFLESVMKKCSEGISGIETFKKELHEKTGGKNIPFTQIDAGWLAGKVQKLETLKQEITKDKNFYLFMMHIVQSYIIKAEIETNALEGAFRTENEINAAKIKILSQWFPTIGKLTKIARDHLENAKKIVEA